jgi:hypothetical protein
MNGFERKRRWFFALIRELKLDVEEARTRACEKFDLDNFSLIKEYQLDHLIGLLLERKRHKITDY